MLWGYALVWMSKFLQRDPDTLMAKLKFLVDYDLKTTGVSVAEIAKLDDAKREEVAQYIADHELAIHLYANAPYLKADLDTVSRSIDETVQDIERYHGLLRCPLVTTGVGSYHRFMRSPSLAEQMDRLAQTLPALAASCHSLGIPFGIENHGDYYCSDLVELVQQVPHLGIFLDTGNTYLIGEAPLPAFRAAAPYVVGTHFKDHHVRPRPDARPLHFEVDASIIGDGDVPLRECYQILIENIPNPEKLVMEIELIPPSGIPATEILERSLAFVRSLEPTL
jgi:sugar phosphate isomerase/epimerase